MDESVHMVILEVGLGVFSILSEATARRDPRSRNRTQAYGVPALPALGGRWVGVDVDGCYGGSSTPNQIRPDFLSYKRFFNLMRLIRIA